MVAVQNVRPQTCVKAGSFTFLVSLLSGGFPLQCKLL